MIAEPWLVFTGAAAVGAAGGLVAYLAYGRRGGSLQVVELVDGVGEHPTSRGFLVTGADGPAAAYQAAVACVNERGRRRIVSSVTTVRPDRRFEVRIYFESGRGM